MTYRCIHPALGICSTRHTSPGPAHRHARTLGDGWVVDPPVAMAEPPDPRRGRPRVLVREELVAELREHDGVIARAAAALGVSDRIVHMRAREWGLRAWARELRRESARSARTAARRKAAAAARLEHIHRRWGPALAKMTDEP